ncbi:hypothetical protein BC351_21860 [Paenibacillus ferrarius]|uniref:Lipoprotein n=1 Tax=Paenibacillus ferrarius TaxID=1469647 RepID=A0A1V4HMS2_9BACL|nr:hypothetical protein [Paenibacillus ferrarius]OPH58984.1 hypothetical protein BC351_21860 [Paenibacillus ferrarius]
MKANMKKMAGICVLVPVLLTGCASGSQPADGKAAAAASTAQPAQNQEQGTKNAANNGANRPAMSTEQRQMFSTMQTLLMLDKADGLAITKDQAQVMLPVAEEAVTKGELTDDNKTKLLEKLTDAQKKFVEDAATRMNNRGNGNGGNGGPNGGTNGDKGNGGGGKRGNAAGDPAKAPAASAKPDASGGSSTGTGNEQAPAKGQGDGKGPAGNGGGNRGFGDPGKQLVELLQTKLK